MSTNKQANIALLWWSWISARWSCCRSSNTSLHHYCYYTPDNNCIVEHLCLVTLSTQWYIYQHFRGIRQFWLLGLGMLCLSDRITLLLFVQKKATSIHRIRIYLQLKRYEQRINLYQFNRLFIQEYDCMALFLIQLLSILCNFLRFFFVCCLWRINRMWSCYVLIRLLCEGDTFSW